MTSAKELARRGDVDALVQALSDPSRERRLAAATALRDVPEPRAELALLKVLEDESVLVRQAALGSLVALDPDRDPAPVVAAARRRAAQDSSTMVRVRAEGQPVGPDELVWLGLWRLRRLKPVESLLAAVSAGDSIDWLLRADAVQVLGKLGDPRAIAPLIDELGHEHAAVRDAAAEALGALGEPKSGPALAQALNDQTPRVRRSAARSLARLDTPEAVAALRSATRSAGALDRLYVARLLVARRLRRARASRVQPNG